MKGGNSGQQIMLPLLKTKQNDLLKESDRIRKQFNKNEIQLDSFVEDYIKSQTQYHQIEATKMKISLG